jgi:hypothetical protein
MVDTRFESPKSKLTIARMPLKRQVALLHPPSPVRIRPAGPDHRNVGPVVFEVSFIQNVVLQLKAAMFRCVP